MNFQKPKAFCAGGGVLVLFDRNQTWKTTTDLAPAARITSRRGEKPKNDEHLNDRMSRKRENETGPVGMTALHLQR
jgi:hypothetical protein